MKILDKIDKKVRYGIFAFIYIVYVYFASIVFWNSSLYLRVSFGTLLVVISTFFIHYPNLSLRPNKSIASLILPLSLLASTLLSFKYYPALSIQFKVVALLIASGVFYLISLVDNIFLIVKDRAESIPLYRAAIPWGQILIVTLSIPLFAGVFKIPINPILQTSIIGLISFVMTLYQFWFLREETNLIPLGAGGSLIMSAFVGFIVYVVAVAMSFISTESFMRSLVAGSALMLGIMFVYAYLKNSINKKILFEYFIILIIFILFSFLFKF